VGNLLIAPLWVVESQQQDPRSKHLPLRTLAGIRQLAQELFFFDC